MNTSIQVIILNFINKNSLMHFEQDVKQITFQYKLSSLMQKTDPLQNFASSGLQIVQINDESDRASSYTSENSKKYIQSIELKNKCRRLTIIIENLKKLYFQIKLYFNTSIPQFHKFLAEEKAKADKNLCLITDKIIKQNCAIEQLQKRNQYLQQVLFDVDQKMQAIQLQIEDRIKQKKQLLEAEIYKKYDFILFQMKKKHTQQIRQLQMELERRKQIYDNKILQVDNVNEWFSNKEGLYQKEDQDYNLINKGSRYRQHMIDCNFSRTVSEHHYRQDKNIPVYKTARDESKSGRGHNIKKKGYNYTAVNRFKTQEDEFVPFFDWSASEAFPQVQMPNHQYFDFDPLESTASAMYHQPAYPLPTFQSAANAQFTQLGCKIGNLKLQIQRQIDNFK